MFDIAIAGARQGRTHACVMRLLAHPGSILIVPRKANLWSIQRQYPEQMFGEMHRVFLADSVTSKRFDGITPSEIIMDDVDECLRVMLDKQVPMFVTLRPVGAITQHGVPLAPQRKRRSTPKEGNPAHGKNRG